MLRSLVLLGMDVKIHTIEKDSFTAIETQSNEPPFFSLDLSVSLPRLDSAEQTTAQPSFHIHSLKGKTSSQFQKFIFKERLALFEEFGYHFVKQ